MNDTRDFDRAVARWLDVGSDATPPEVIDSVLLAVRTMPQERDLRNLRRTPTMTMFMRAAAAVAIVAVAGVSALYALGFRPNVGFLPAGDPPSPFQGTWVSTSDADGGTQTMTIQAPEVGAVEIVVHDDIASVCAGVPATMTGTGRLEGSTQLVIPSPLYTCDDGSEPAALGGPPLQEQLRNLAFVHDPVTDALTDTFGSVWAREGAENPSPEPNTSGPPLTAAQKATIGRLVDALNAAAAGDTGDEASLLDVFTEDAMIGPMEGRDGSPVTEPGLLEAWILHLRTWGFEGDVVECLTDAADRFCVVRARWHTVLAEADEYWHVDFVGDRIQMLTINMADGGRHGDPVLPLSLAELDGWEDWLQQTDPDTAARLTRYKDTSRLFPAVPRYDPRSPTRSRRRSSCTSRNARPATRSASPPTSSSSVTASSGSSATWTALMVART